MAGEEFVIRVTKKGEIFVEMDGLPVQRVRDLVRYFEETLGPGRLTETDDSGTTGRAALEEASLREWRDEEEERPAERLRVEEQGEEGGR